MSPIKVLKQELIDGFKQSKWLPLITAYAGISGIIGPGPHYPMMHLPFIMFCLFMMWRDRTSKNIVPLFLLLYLPLNIIVSHPDPVFRSWQRLGLFAIVFIFASPLLMGRKVAQLRRKVLLGMLFIAVLVSLGSIACYFLGINYMRNQFSGEEVLVEVGSGFGGLTIQSIALGQLCGLSILYVTYRSLRQPTNNRKWYWAVVVALTMLLLASSSRSALLAALAGILILIYSVNKKNGKFIKIVLSIIVLATLTYPIWEGVTVGLADKQMNNVELGVYGSRTEKWTARITEFASSPIYGVGFAAQDPNGKDYYDAVTGTVEPGSSWLCILSMTGIIGFILVVSMFTKAYKYLSTHSAPYNALLLSLLAFISLNMMAEGYIFAGGGAGCFMAWLIIGCANDAEYLEDNEY